jgi:Ca2+-binding EF-hand superfamily protein
MKSLTRSTLLACAATLALASGAWAQGSKDTAAANKSAIEAAFKRADSNGDGKLSKEESARLPEIQANFETLDKDKDGSLSMAEFNAAFEAPKQ